MNDGPCTWSILTIHKPDFSSMCPGYLLRERESDTASFRLCGVDGHLEILGIGNAEAAVFDANHDARFSDAPPDTDWFGTVRQGGIHGVG